MGWALGKWRNPVRQTQPPVGSEGRCGQLWSAQENLGSEPAAGGLEAPTPAGGLDLHSATY